MKTTIYTILFIFYSLIVYSQYDPITKTLKWGDYGAILQTSQGASIELRGNGVPYFDFSNDATTDYDMRLILMNDNELHVNGGDLVVGGKLKVTQNTVINAKLEAKEIKVTLTPTADFVFNEIYVLPTLDFIENYIKKNKHLPEIASAKEMKQEGVNIGNFQIQLLQKIEELTLYTIEQQKEIEKLKSTNDKLIEIQIRLDKLESKN
jgi:hypothetical protein